MLGLAACSESDVSVTGVRLDNNTLELTVGETGNLNATVLPENATNRNVVWNSSNTTVATVNAQGVVNAVSAGNAVITVRTVDGGRETTATVTVNAAIIRVASVAITRTPSPLSLTVGEVEPSLSVLILPLHADNRNITWSSGNTDVITVNPNTGEITAVGVGTTTIIVTTECGGHTDSFPVEVAKPANMTDAGVVINGIRWATRNVDAPGTFAPYPHSAGRLYQWGTLDSQTHHWPSTGAFVTGWNNSDNRIAWTTANDPCPEGWRVPTRAELEQLHSVIGNWTTRNGVNGRYFGTAPNQIFLPAADFRDHTGMLFLFAGTGGNYWSSTQSAVAFAWRLNFGGGGGSITDISRSHGNSIRCVAE